MTNIAVVIMSFDRPEYFSRCIESLEHNYNTVNYDFIILQDGVINRYSNNIMADESDVNKCIEIAENADLPNKEVRVNEFNIGIGLQRDKVFEIFNEGYDLIFQIEDDVVLGKYALEVLNSMAHQFDDHVCTVHRKIDYENIDDPLDKLNNVIIKDGAHWWTASMWEDNYRQIKNRWKEYVEIIKGYEYKRRPRSSIFNVFPEADIASSDAIAGTLLQQNNIRRVEPVVSRARYIGKHGVHFTPRSYSGKEVGNEGPLEFEQDEEIDKWESMT